MSERKVLNKYYPPDFDPSKIPRSKEKRNKTFVIRLMAPCNMRCTTCGEYIYKGRKFNARKEDVDDMTHLGLRIYRFYIKCTACLGEISFRTDPANTDYVLEAGATRNFEALAKAEKQAERDQREYEEELATNPMKLLEERTEQSKNEMSRMEALEELQEMNKREMEVDYDSMLNKYAKARKSEAEIQEQEDEDFVRKIFSKEGDVTVKRLQDDDESDDSDEDVSRRKRAKAEKAPVEKATDLMVMTAEKKKEKAPWEKSIGGLGQKAGKKGGLGVLVKKKAAPAATATMTTTEAKKDLFLKPAAPPAKLPAKQANDEAGPSTSTAPKSSSQSSSTTTVTPVAPKTKPLGASSLSLIGDYSDSSSSEEDS